MHSTRKSNPVKFDIRILYISSLVIAILVASVSIIGIVEQDRIYPTEKLLQSFIPNDFVNLCIGIPLLLFSIWFARRGKLMGLLCWPGALFYILYVYFPYIICVPFDILFIPYLIIFSTSVYTLITLLVSMDGVVIARQLSGTVPAKLSGGILMGLSVLIILRQTVQMVSALVNSSPIDPQEIAVWIDDFSIASPAMFVGGVLLVKKRPLGYLTGAGLSIVYAALSLGLIPFLAIQSHLISSSFDWSAVVILFVMAAICLIPFGFFVRAANAHPATE